MIQGENANDQEGKTGGPAYDGGDTGHGRGNQCARDPAFLDAFTADTGLTVNVGDYEGTGTGLSMITQSQPGEIAISAGKQCTMSVQWLQCV